MYLLYFCRFAPDKQVDQCHKKLPDEVPDVDLSEQEKACRSYINPIYVKREGEPVTAWVKTSDVYRNIHCYECLGGERMENDTIECAPFYSTSVIQGLLEDITPNFLTVVDLDGNFTLQDKHGWSREIKREDFSSAGHVVTDLMYITICVCVVLVL